jgi:tRNA 2-thiouridine synthesizing protein E
MIRIGERELETDHLGYLTDPGDWDPEVARFMAGEDDINLTPQHWEIIDFLREYYLEYSMAPPMRLLVKAVASRMGEERGNSRYLYRLFPDGPAKQACRYAGLPKPVSCI